jgi:hypothetical protein
MRIDIANASSHNMRVPSRRFLVVILAVVLPLVLGTVAYSATSSPGKSGTAPGKQKAGQQSTEKEDEAEGQGTPGGSIDRFHEGCHVPESVADQLKANWTHGMYVSAITATTNDPTKIVEAAHSRCGKPSHAGLNGHFGAGGLPPGLAKKAENQPSP